MFFVCPSQRFSYKKFREQSGIFYWPLSYVALHFFPALILHWGCLPLYYVLSNPTPSPTTPLDYAAFAFTIGAIILEATADQQLLDFTEKKITDPSLVRLFTFTLKPSILRSARGRTISVLEVIFADPFSPTFSYRC